MLASGRLPYVMRGLAATTVQPRPSKTDEGRYTPQPSEDPREAPVFQRGTQKRPETPVEPTRPRWKPEEQSEEQSQGWRKQSAANGGQDSTKFLQQFLERYAESAKHIARNFPGKFREHATAHVSKSQEMPEMMTAFAAKTVTAFVKVVTVVSGTRKGDEEK